MEAERFDQAVRALSLAAYRRRGVVALLGGVLAAALPGLETAAKRRGTPARHSGKKTHQARGEGKKKKKPKKPGGPRGPQTNPGPPPPPSPPPPPPPPPPLPAPVIACPACGACQGVDFETGETGLPCATACLAGTLCAQANASLNFIALAETLTTREFIPQGEPHAFEALESGTVAGSILLASYLHRATGKVATLGFRIGPSGDRDVLAIIGKPEEQQASALMVDSNGHVEEVFPDPLGSTGLRKRASRAHGAPQLVVGDCNPNCGTYCLVGVGVGTFAALMGFGLLAIAASRAGAEVAVTRLLGERLIGLDGALAALGCGKFCRYLCDCPSANCQSICNAEASECRAACAPGGSAGGEGGTLIDPGGCRQECMNEQQDCKDGCNATCKS